LERRRQDPWSAAQRLVVQDAQKDAPGRVAVSDFWRLAMIAVGVIFVANSLDSLIRLYTQNLGLTVQRLGTLKYVVGNWLALFGLVLLYQFTPLEIEWVGLVVIGLYAAIYTLVFRRRATLATA